jgi:hypothetical protein
MNNKNKLALILSLGALLPLAASAKTLEQSYIDSCRKGADIPVPVTVVAPAALGYDIGQALEVRFVVDAAGLPSGIAIKSCSDGVFAQAVADAVSQWRFAPARRNGAPVPMKVILPVRVVRAGDRNA